MFGKLSRVTVEISSRAGIHFSGPVTAVELSAADGSFEIAPDGAAYLRFSHSTQLAIRQGLERTRFTLVNATACLGNKRLVVLAEVVTREDESTPGFRVIEGGRSAGEAHTNSRRTPSSKAAPLHVYRTRCG
jgi:hypothetical protein